MSTACVLERRQGRKDGNRAIHSQKNPAPVATAEWFPINFPKGRISPIASHLLGQLHKQPNKQKTHLASTIISDIPQIVYLKISLSIFCCRFLSLSLTPLSVNGSGAGGVHASSLKARANMTQWELDLGHSGIKTGAPKRAVAVANSPAL